jgi:ribonuclease D
MNPERKDRRLWRPQKRAQSHRESHENAEPHGPPAAHPLASAEPPVLVTTADGLAETVEHLRAAGQFAFDSEFIGEVTYLPRLCLVQVATTQRVCLVDPMARLDLGGLWELIVSPSCRKIVFAGQQDLAPVVRVTGRAPAGIVDLQIAAGFVRTQYPLSLGKLLEEFVGVSVGKAHTFSHWDKRPLTDRQVRYAADDVRYLPAAYAAIQPLLSELGRDQWAAHECAAALEDPSAYASDAASLYLRIRAWRNMRPRQLAVLRALAILRDRLAMKEDVPVRSLLNDGVLCAMARRPPRSLAELDGVRGLPRPVERQYGRDIIEAVAAAVALPPDQLPAPDPQEQAEDKDRSDAVMARIVELCQARSIAPALVVPSRRELMAALAAPAGKRAAHRLWTGWRRELLGDMLERA